MPMIVLVNTINRLLWTSRAVNSNVDIIIPVPYFLTPDKASIPRTVAKFAPHYQHEAGGVTDEFRQLPDLRKSRLWPDVSGVLLRSYLDWHWVSSFLGSDKCDRYQVRIHGPPSTPPRPYMALYFLQCSIERQNCDSSWPRATSQQVAFTNTSCVRDSRLPGDVGRCGWQGAPCQVNGTVSNCALRKLILAIPPRPAPLIIPIQPSPRFVAVAYAQGMFFAIPPSSPLLKSRS